MSEVICLVCISDSLLMHAGMDVFFLISNF